MFERTVVAAVAGGTVRLNNDQARLRRGTVMSGEELVVENHSTAHAGSEREENDISETSGGTEPGFPHHCTVPVIGKRDSAVQP